jgi:hypothetical protein
LLFSTSAVCVFHSPLHRIEQNWRLSRCEALVLNTVPHWRQGFVTGEYLVARTDLTGGDVTSAGDPNRMLVCAPEHTRAEVDFDRGGTWVDLARLDLLPLDGGSRPSSNSNRQVPLDNVTDPLEAPISKYHRRIR